MSLFNYSVETALDENSLAYFIKYSTSILSLDLVKFDFAIYFFSRDPDWPSALVINAAWFLDIELSIDSFDFVLKSIIDWF